MKTKFWGKSLEVQAVGLSHTRLEGRNEMYSVQRPSTIVNILGKLSLEHHGVLTCQRENSDFEVSQQLGQETDQDPSTVYSPTSKLQITFKRQGWMNADDRNRIEATIPLEPGSEHFWTLSGKWNEEIIALRSDTYEEIVIWRANPLPYQHDYQYYFTKFAININTLPDSLKAKIPHTDSRLRPDQRALEEGDFD